MNYELYKHTTIKYFKGDELMLRPFKGDELIRDEYYDGNPTSLITNAMR